MNIQSDLAEWAEAVGAIGSRNIDAFGTGSFLLVMLLSLVCAALVSLLYVVFFKERNTGSEVHRAFPLLGISITAIFICVQFSLPLSLGLLGALSIVRFRTPIKEPEEIGFIMVVVACSLACATFNIMFLGVILALTVASLLAARTRRSLQGGRSGDGTLVVSMPVDAYAEKGRRLIEFLSQTAPRGRLDSLAEEQGETTVTYRFQRLDEAVLARLPGEIREIVAETRTSLFLDHSGRV